MRKFNPRIYVACLASYNNGRLHGCWIDADQDVESIQAEIQAMLRKSPEPGAEEYAIHDYEDFGGCGIEEYTDIETVVQVAEFIQEHGEAGAAVLNYLGNDLDTAKTMMEDQFQGLYDWEVDFVRERVEEIWEIPDHLEIYIDYERIAKDWFISDYLSIEAGNRVAVFSQY